MIFTYVGYMAGYALDAMLTAGFAAVLAPWAILRRVAGKTKPCGNVLEA